MNTPSAAQRGLLVVESSAEIQEILQTLFTEEGYAVRFAASIQEALPLVDAELFHMILADLFASKAQPSFTEVHTLLRRALPTPVGLMTTYNLLPEEAEREGFAFLIRKPFDLEELLAMIAHALQRPLTPTQQRQALLVERYFAALNERSWDTLAAICTDEVIYYPPAQTPFTSARKVMGKGALRAHLDRSARQFPFHVEEKILYPRRKGLAARYMMCRSRPGVFTERHTGSILFHFAGERICAIGSSANFGLLRLLITQARAS